jgi:hypothetical protein
VRLWRERHLEPNDVDPASLLTMLAVPFGLAAVIVAWATSGAVHYVAFGISTVVLLYFVFVGGQALRGLRRSG